MGGRKQVRKIRCPASSASIASMAWTGVPG